MEDKYVKALGAAMNKLARIEYSKTDEYGGGTEAFIGELNYLHDGYIDIELPYNIKKKEIHCGGMGTPVASVVITPVSDEEKNVWLKLAIDFIERGREYDKWDRSISFSGYEYIEECKYVDACADGRLKRVRGLEKYQGRALKI